MDRNEGDENKATRENLYYSYVDNCNKNIKSNLIQFDKAILTLSSAGLGLSFLLIDGTLFNLKKCVSTWLLKSSWLGFSIAIICTVLSYFFSNAGIRKSISYAERLYIDNDKDYFNKESLTGKIGKYLTWSSGILFVLGVIFLLSFAWANLNC